MRKRLVLLGILSLIAGHTAGAAEVWHSGTLKSVYPSANGDFVIIFDVDSASCTGGGPGKFHHVTVGQNGVTADGSKKIYALMLAAMMSRNPVSIAFDDSSGACYVNRASIHN